MLPLLSHSRKLEETWDILPVLFLRLAACSPGPPPLIAGQVPLGVGWSVSIQAKTASWLVEEFFFPALSARETDCSFIHLLIHSFVFSKASYSVCRTVLNLARQRTD